MPARLMKHFGGAFYDTYTLDPAGPEDAARVAARRDAEKAWQRGAQREALAAKQHLVEIHAVERPVPRDLVPETLTLSRGKALPDFVEFSPAGSLVSARLKALLERHEPAGPGHQFLPITITRKTGPDITDYHVWDVIRRLDAMDPTSEALKTVAGEVNGAHRWTLKATSSPWGPEALRVRAEIAGDASVWRDWRFQPNQPFVSDALYAAMCDAGITGFEASVICGLI